MFTNKYYTAVYNSTINKAIIRNFGKARGRERHHVIPQSLGGTNDKGNLVYLTCREHFLCHWLLLKITTGENYHKMRYALMGMRAENEHQERYHTKLTARIYEKYRIEHAAHHSKVMKAKRLVPWNKGGVAITDDHRENLRKAALNRPPMSEKTKEKMRISLLGHTDSTATKLKKSMALKGKPKGPMSEEQKLKRSLKQKGVKKVKTHSANVAAAMTGNIAINKDNVEKKVKQPDLQTWLNQGWSIGGKKRIRE